MNLQGIHALVTGAAGGIGSAICRMLLDSGAATVGALDIKPIEPQERLIPLRADIRDAAHIQDAMTHFPTLHVLIHAAAVLLDGAVAAASFRGMKKYPEDHWDTTLDTNLKGAFLVAREAIPSMIRAKSGGVIVNISSISRAGRAGQASYAASKGGVVALTATLAQELAPHRIRAVAIAPGLVDTPMATTIPEAHRNDMLARVAIGRMGSPCEIAHAARFCIENEFFNGRVLEVDGGAY
jgi:3-oxoacyl-[acyl-carrier protein] reductase